MLTKFLRYLIPLLLFNDFVHCRLSSQIPFFEDVGAITLLYLDTLMQRDNLEKSQFFKGLPQVVAKLPKVSLLARVF
jgi:hypothetical protein